MAVVAKDVLDNMSALLNDTAKSAFSDANMLPYLNIAVDELQEVLEQNNISITNEVSTGLIVTAGTTVILATQLPPDLIEIRGLYERTNGSSEDYQIMTRVEFLPPFVEQLQSLVYFTYQNQEIRFIGATSDRQLLLEYIAKRLPKLVQLHDPITLINAKTFLEYRGAALCAMFIGENEQRAQVLNSQASEALDRFLTINIKGKQSIFTRRRPFMSSYKVRTGF